MTPETSKQPGGWVLARSRREWFVSTTFIVSMVVLGAAAVLAILLRGPLLVIVLLLALAGAFGRLALIRADVATRWTKGGRSEEAVGELLNALRADGYTVRHDLEQRGEGNVDHLVSGPTGLFLVETKHRRYEANDLTKAKRQAAKLHDDFGAWVTPVICVDRRRRSPIRHAGVWVMSPDHLLAWIRAQRRRSAGVSRS